MKIYSVDISYAYVRLGIEAGAPFDEIEKVLINARSYKYFSRPRIKEVSEWVDFFRARAKLGDISASFADIKKSYHQKAMFLHPDRNKANSGTEDQLKEINLAYACVEKVHRQAVAYYKQDHKIRSEQEEIARQATSRERPPEPDSLNEKQDPERFSESFRAWGIRKSSSSTPTNSIHRKYMAASVPRFLRQTKLGYLPLHCVIGSHTTKGDGGSHLYFDVIMLPSREFVRMKTNIGLQHIITPQLKAGASFNPVFILTDTKEITVPEAESDPLTFAKDYFLKQFNLKKK